MNKQEIIKLLSEYNKARGDYYFKYLDETLFDLCKKFPDHTDEQKVFAKVAIINNVYRANLHMSGRGAEQRLAAHLVKVKFDDKIELLRNMSAFDKATINDIVRIHGYFVRLTDNLLGKRAISFCSKYLNFHFPNIVPIFDSRAYKTIWRYVGAELNHLDYDDKINADYAYFCDAILEIVKILEANHVKHPSLKIIDVLLYDTLYRE